MGSFSVSGACVVVDTNSNVLLIQRADNKEWQIPGGVVELGETPKQATIRETLEEAGIVIYSPRLTGVYTNVRAGIFAHVFRADRFSGEPRVSDESIRADFFPVKKALDLVPEIFTLRITDALNFNGGSVVMRAHDGVKWLD